MEAGKDLRVQYGTSLSGGSAWWGRREGVVNFGEPPPQGLLPLSLYLAGIGLCQMWDNDLQGRKEVWFGLESAEGISPTCT